MLIAAVSDILFFQLTELLSLRNFAVFTVANCSSSLQFAFPIFFSSAWIASFASSPTRAIMSLGFLGKIPHYQSMNSFCTHLLFNVRLGMFLLTGAFLFRFLSASCQLFITRLVVHPYRALVILLIVHIFLGPFVLFHFPVVPFPYSAVLSSFFLRVRS